MRRRTDTQQLRPVRGDDGQWACLDCGKPLDQPVYDGKKRRTGVRCTPCGITHHLYMRHLTGKGLATAAVSRAKKLGELPPAEGHKCVDCGMQAEVYDHRDYNKPLAVDPVCRSCNVRRGSAIPFNPLLVGLLLLASAA